VHGSKPSTSAQTVAMCRAVLTSMGVLDDALAVTMLHRPQRLLARWFGHPPLTQLARSPTFSFLAARTSFFDDAVTSALDSGVEQVAIIGAGYDSRAWRLARPGVHFFEVDHPATQRDKRRGAPEGGPTFVAADLDTERLTALLPAAGLDTKKSTVFIVEGLTMYLSEPTVRRMLRDLTTLSPAGSRLAANFTVKGGGSSSPLSRSVAWITRVTWRARGEPTHRWVDPHTLEDVLLTCGWTACEVVPAPELAARFLGDTDLRLDGLNPGAICVAATPA
jgi:methyltransferase (TIGR00027 family)